MYVPFGHAGEPEVPAAVAGCGLHQRAAAGKSHRHRRNRCCAAARYCDLPADVIRRRRSGDGVLGRRHRARSIPARLGNRVDRLARRDRDRCRRTVVDWRSIRRRRTIQSVVNDRARGCIRQRHELRRTIGAPANREHRRRRHRLNRQRPTRRRDHVDRLERSYRARQVEQRRSILRGVVNDVQHRPQRVGRSHATHLGQAEQIPASRSQSPAIPPVD